MKLMHLHTSVISPGPLRLSFSPVVAMFMHWILFRCCLMLHPRLYTYRAHRLLS